jgi:hypothetical protein
MASDVYNRLVFSHALHRVSAFELFGPLRDPEFFAQVRIDAEAHTLVWPNGADFDPATLHDWPLVVDELSARALRWDSRPGQA